MYLEMSKSVWLQGKISEMGGKKKFSYDKTKIITKFDNSKRMKKRKITTTV